MSFLSAWEVVHSLYFGAIASYEAFMRALRSAGVEFSEAILMENLFLGVGKILLLILSLREEWLVLLRFIL